MLLNYYSLTHADYYLDGIRSEHYDTRYIYGGLIASSSSIATPSSSYPANQPYRYNGKELDRKNNLDWMDYGARHFAGHGQWTSLDPLAEKYYDWSPYVYCVGNPIKFVDPDGRNPIYNLNGELIGCTSEGYNGTIYVYNGVEDIDFGNYSIDYLLEEYGYSLLTYDNVEENYRNTNKHGEFVSNVMTDIAQHFDGIAIFGETFKMSKIQSQAIAYEFKEGQGGFTTESYLNSERLPNIIARGYTSSKFEGTVENFASCILVHEWYSHDILGYGDKNKNHHKSYETQERDTLFYPYTTDNFKSFVRNMKNTLTSKEK